MTFVGPVCVRRQAVPAPSWEALNDAGGHSSCVLLMGETLMAGKAKPHRSVADRQAQGSDARSATPPLMHAGWTPAVDRPDPVALLEEQNVTREPDLVPVRHGRMMVSPFTFTGAQPRSWRPIWRRLRLRG